ncbi:Protein N-acetyltransferase, RimJ/RimL family [Pseudomonas pohangensis]|uniref:Protein N-acetyltransferase, RimJ/RimL family n=1 Tax=Pseudomonas pohangensis TaxID=364197 RepID=A0A1H2H5K8_9PSED|nr:GNAT family N-acetyltransferase [Pseudomonas pohangensis]SDU26868.1 Protein N-acetyltransferase, RimJ/RimL family [Pseudomonas pohangensis]
MPLPELHTARLHLRNWQPADLPRFAVLNDDAQVMQYFPGRFDREQSDALAARIQRHIEQNGFGVWVLERHEQPGLIGILGLQQVQFDSAFTPAVEIAWRLLPAFWHQGLATEAAQAALRFAFEQLALPQVLAFTVPANLPSQALMQRLGMQRDPAEDFLHPLLPKNHPLRPHLLYRLEQARWLRLQQAAGRQ